MADAAPVVHIGENSPEEVAYKLFLEVAYAEGKDIWKGSSGMAKGDRKWILDTYSECVLAVTSPHARLRNPARG